MTKLSKEQKDLLLLYQCIIDTGAEVLREFTEPRLISGFKDFTEMLEKKKHYFFHQNNKKRLHCCECPLIGCSIPFNGDLDKSLFDKMYVYDSTIIIPKGHHNNNGTVRQICLCRFQVTTISINDFDLSNLNYLILKLRLLNKHEHNLKDALQNIMKIRGNVMHAVSSQCYRLCDLVILWNDFETAIIQFAPPNSSFLVKKLIAKDKKELLSEDDINSLMTKVLKDHEKAEDDNMNLIHSIEEKVSAIERNTTTIVGAVASTEENIKTHVSREMRTMGERIKEHLVGMLCNQKVILSVSQQQLPIVRGERGADEGNGHDQQQINATAKMTSNSLTEQAEDTVLECLPTEKETKIKDSPPEDTDDRFGILSKRKNCIILELLASPRIFTNKERLRSAILKLVREVLLAGNIDTSIEDSIYVKMDFDTPLTRCQYDVLMELMSTQYIDKVELDKSHSVQSHPDPEPTMLRRSARKRKSTYQIRDGVPAAKEKLPRVKVPVVSTLSFPHQSAIPVPPPVDVATEPKGVLPVHQLQQCQSVVPPVGTIAQAIDPEPATLRRSARKRKSTYQIRDGAPAAKEQLPRVKVPVVSTLSIPHQSAIPVPPPVDVATEPKGVLPVHQLQQCQSVVPSVGTIEQAIENTKKKTDSKKDQTNIPRNEILDSIFDIRGVIGFAVAMNFLEKNLPS